MRENAMPRNWIIAAIAAASLLSATSAHAAQVKVLVSGAMAHALQEVAEDFAKKNGHMLDFQVGTTGVVQDKVRMGEKADIVEVTSAGMDQLEKEKLVMPGTRVELARALIGVAVRDGSPVPDISTPVALKQRLMSAKAVAYIDPKVGGQAGAAIVGMLGMMGITDDVAKKAVYGKTGAEAVQKMANGEADIAISFVSEMLPIKGAKVVGTLPMPLQNPSQYAAAIGSASTNPAVARDLLKAMQSAEARRVMVNAGLEPVTNGVQPIK
jgi:molybdate transport system substrate-binding protein